MANNHSGSVDHAKTIIVHTLKFANTILTHFALSSNFNLELNTFIRRDFSGKVQVPLIKRFERRVYHSMIFRNLSFL